MRSAATRRRIAHGPEEDGALWTRRTARLTQSNADEAALVGSIQKDVFPTGTEDVDGVTWVVYQGGEGAEPVWTTRLDSAKGPTQVAISGSGSPEDFRALAIATQTQLPLG